MSMSNCLSVFVCYSSHNSKTTRPNFTDFYSCCLPGAVIRSSSVGVLPFLWMTSCFHTIGQITRENQARRYISKFARWRYQMDVRQLRCFVELAAQENAALEGAAKSCYLRLPGLIRITMRIVDLETQLIVLL